MSKTWKAVLGVFVIYLFGCFSGVVSTSIFFHHKMLIFLKHPGTVLLATMEKRMTGNLSLDANQKQQVHDYFLQNLQQRKELQKQIQPQVQELNRQMIKEINTVLHPDQQERFRENVAQFKHRFVDNPLNPNAANQQPSSPATNSSAGQQPDQ